MLCLGLYLRPPAGLWTRKASLGFWFRAPPPTFRSRVAFCGEISSLLFPFPTSSPSFQVCPNPAASLTPMTTFSPLFSMAYSFPARAPRHPSSQLLARLRPSSSSAPPTSSLSPPLPLLRGVVCRGRGGAISAGRRFLTSWPRQGITNIQPLGKTSLRPVKICESSVASPPPA